jgi:hypothetical protein
MVKVKKSREIQSNSYFPNDLLMNRRDIGKITDTTTIDGKKVNVLRVNGVIKNIGDNK